MGSRVHCPGIGCCYAFYSQTQRCFGRPNRVGSSLSAFRMSRFAAAKQKADCHCWRSGLAIRCESDTNGRSSMVGTSVAPDTRPNRLAEFFSEVCNLPWQKLVSWAVVAFFAAQLKDFFGIMMGTFVLSFIGNGFVEGAQQWPLLSWMSSKARRRFLVLMYYTAIISLVTLFGVSTIPDMVREGADFVERLQNDNIWVVVLTKMRSGLGDGVMEQFERFLLLASSDDVVHVAGDLQTSSAQHAKAVGLALQKIMRGYTEAAVTITSTLLTQTTRFLVQVGVSLVLSFMFVWDLPTIARGVASLQTSRMAPVYNEVAPSLQVFGQLFGKALGAQTQIAMVNTALTAISMWALQIPGIAILSLFVFICGFIPIAGCFISTVPIGFVALTEYGFIKLALVLLMVTAIHFIEAYGLNPAIYSAHLKLHPLLVLAVLVVAEHSLGIWGLLLAVPLTVFTLDYLLRYPACSVTDVASKELQKVNSNKEAFDNQRSTGRAGSQGTALFKMDMQNAPNEA